MIRYIYDVTLPDGTTERWNCYSVEHSNGRLIIFDQGVQRIYGPSEWEGVTLVETIEVVDEHRKA